MDNRELILNRVKEYYRTNIVKKREYYEKNNDKYRQYYQDNKEIYKERAKATYECRCGSIVVIYKKLRHDKSIKHKTFEKNYITQ